MEHSRRTKRRKRVIAFVVSILWLPAALVLLEATTFWAQNHHNGSILSSGKVREYVLYVPSTYDASSPTPLVIALHGAGGWGALQMRISQWRPLADEHGFIVVYPSGLGQRGPRVWRVSSGPGLGEDVEFISDLIDDLENDYNIDSSRIYANGLSNGGGMSWALSCTLSDRIAAVGLVAAARTLSWDWCTDRKPVPVISFHGTADPLTPYEGGTSWAFDEHWPDVREWDRNWTRRNRCAAAPETTRISDHVIRTDFEDCAEGASVSFVTIEGGGHTWPGGAPLPEWLAGPTNREIQATELMWEFFLAHPLGPQVNSLASNPLH